jgi:hypothetical protein
VTRRTALRLLLGALAVSAALPGAWATLTPSGFFGGFPGPGAGDWVAALPPFNEHLVRDVGAFYLAFAVLFGWAAWRPDPALVTPLAVGWSVFSVLHLGYHLTALGPLSASDAAAQTVSLAAVLAAALLAARLAAREAAAR